MTDTWIDWAGREWRVVQSPRRLRFSRCPGHAALRAHVLRRDGFCCVRCGAKAIDVPADYDGQNALFTNTRLSSGWPDLLVVDHILTLNAGGKSVVENLQALCETCNRRKVREDNAATRAYRARFAA